jgi:hypothetical protein
VPCSPEMLASLAIRLPSSLLFLSASTSSYMNSFLLRRHITRPFRPAKRYICNNIIIIKSYPRYRPWIL